MPPEDPRCPDCGEPVGATADYCLHCRADRDESVEAAVVDLRGPSGDAAGTAGGAGDGPAEPAAAGDDAGVARAAGPGTRRGWEGPDVGSGATDGPTGDRRWFHPDSLLDDVSTGLVGIVAGGVVGFLAMVLVLVTVRSVVGFLVWPVGWVAVGLYVGWTRTVFGAVRKACYLLAPTLLALPLFWFGPALSGGTFEGRVFAFAVSEVIAVPVALALVGVGYWVGGKAPVD